MKPNLFLLLSCLCGLLTACQPQKTETTMPPLAYPKTEKVSQTDTYFGTKVEDPYRWLENDTAANVKNWVEAQNKVTFDYLAHIPFRDKIRKRYEALYNYPKYGSPYRIGNYYLFSKNEGMQNQSVTYIQTGLDGTPEVFLDPNLLSKDGTVTANIVSVSNDKKYVAVSSQKAGSDWQEFSVMEVATKKPLPDKLEWVKFSGAAWYKNGFFYSTFQKPAPGKELSSKNEFAKIMYHKLGTPQSQDELVYEDKAHPLRYFGIQTTEDEHFLLLYVSEGTQTSEIYYKDLKAGDKNFKPLLTGFEYENAVLDNVGDKLLVQHNRQAPNFKLSVIDPKTGAMTDFIAEKPEKLEAVGTAGGKVFASYLKDVNTQVYQHDLTTGKMEREIKFPALGTAFGFGGNKDDTFIFYTFTSFTYPPTIYKYELASGTSAVFRKPEVKFNPEDYETKQVFYKSKDGTAVPMFLTYKKGLKMDGSNPTLLYAYGGFNISITPYFSTSDLILLENGGIYAVANLRGGGEYGEKWHKGGMLKNKQNVFDDFIGAAEYLIAEKYTSKEKLAIEGGSNGGLLVGACLTQRPDLYQVAFPEVGVLDMLRYHKFTIGYAWASEFGSADSSEASFKNLYAYSPLHNLKAGTAYPATLVMTSDHDDRVVPAHSFKFAATLQEKHKGNAPVLIRIETNAGHGAGKPTSKIIEEQADKWAFMFYNMGISVKD